MGEERRQRMWQLVASNGVRKCDRNGKPLTFETKAKAAANAAPYGLSEGDVVYVPRYLTVEK